MLQAGACYTEPLVGGAGAAGILVYSWSLVAVDTFWQLNFAAALIVFHENNIPAESKLQAWSNRQTSILRRGRPGLRIPRPRSASCWMVSTYNYHF